MIGETKFEINDSSIYEKSFENWDFYYPSDYNFYDCYLKLGTNYDRTVRVIYSENNSEDITTISESTHFRDFLRIGADTYSSFASLHIGFYDKKKHELWNSLKVRYTNYNNEQCEVDILSPEFDGWVHELKWSIRNYLTFIGESLDGIPLEGSCSVSTRNPLEGTGKYGSYSGPFEGYSGVVFNDGKSYAHLFLDKNLNVENSATKYYIALKCAQDLSKCIEIDKISIIDGGVNKGYTPFEIVDTFKDVQGEFIFIALNTHEDLYMPSVTVRFRLASASLTSNYYEMTKQLKGSKESVKITSSTSQDLSDNFARVYAETNLKNNECETGFEWRKYDAPDLVPSSRQPAYVNDGKMICLLDNLDASSYYKYRPYAKVYDKEIFGDWMAFGTTAQHQEFRPIVNTISVTNVTDSTATVSGYFIGGSEPIVEHGFIYQIEGSKVSETVPTTDQQTFLINLQPGTKYNVQAYITTTKETFYGETLNFETPGEGDEDASIDETIVGDIENSIVYNLQGLRITHKSNTLNGMAPGIYITKGRKILIR